MPICVQCTREYINRSHQPTKLCSRECVAKYQSFHNKTGVYKNCSTCKKEIYIIPKKLREFNFCSQKCNGAFGINRRKGITIICENCDKKFYIPKNRIDKAQYCSMSCATKARYIKDPTFNIRKKYYERENHPGWKGGRVIHSSGYILILIGKNKYRFEHRVAMEKELGRPLNRSEHIHHIDGNKTNNDIRNLMLFPNAQAHANYHVSISGTAHRYQHCT